MSVASLLLLGFSGTSQINHPAILSANGYGGTGYDQVGSDVLKTTNGFIVRMETNSDPASGNIGNFCASQGSRTIFLSYSDDGFLQSSRCVGREGDSVFSYMIPQSDGNFVFGGWFMPTVTRGLLISKTDASGSVIWQKNYSKGNAALLRDFIPTSDGGFLMIAESFYTDTNVSVHYGSAFASDVWLLKLDSLGNKMWSNVIGGTDEDHPSKVIEVPGIGFYLVGTTASNDNDFIGNHGTNDGFIVRFDNGGNIIWKKLVGGTDGDGFSYAAYDENNGIVICGTTFSDDGDVMHHINPGMANFWALQVDSASNILWENCYGGYGNEYSQSVCRANDGSIWIAGQCLRAGGQVDTSYNTGNGFLDGWFVHADPAGNFLSAKVVGSSLDDRATMVHPLSSGLVMAGGQYATNNGYFSNFPFHGLNTSPFDAFLLTFAPWTTEVTDISSKIPMVVYPNPASDYFQLNIPYLKKEDDLGITIYDLHGKEIISREVTIGEQVSVKEWAKGVYVIVLKVNSECIGRYKIFVR